ncbi:MAG: hypothetical protein WED04_05785 [Promethearchaeati archaeon SRVP18_Atabeyarchaeia-1]
MNVDGCSPLPAKLHDSSKSHDRKKDSPRKIRVCPFCKKPTLRVADSISGWMTADIYRCDTCGYRGPVFIEVDLDEFEKMMQASPAEDEQEQEEEDEK